MYGNCLGRMKKELLKPTKIYSNEILKISDARLIHASAHITGGGLIENLLRSIPNGLSLNINLSKIKTTDIFKWLKNKNISDQEMLQTFNCGIGMALIISKNDLRKTQNFFANNKEEFFVIGKVIKSTKNEERCIIT